MANVKISLLPSQNDILQVDGLAGYDSSGTIKISGTDLTNSLLSPASGNVLIRPQAGTLVLGLQGQGIDINGNSTIIGSLNINVDSNTYGVVGTGSSTSFSFNGTAGATSTGYAVRLSGPVADSINAVGTSGQVLSSTGSGTQWVTPGGSTPGIGDVLNASQNTFSGQKINFINGGTVAEVSTAGIFAGGNFTISQGGNDTLVLGNAASPTNLLCGAGQISLGDTSNNIAISTNGSDKIQFSCNGTGEVEFYLGSNNPGPAIGDVLTAKTTSGQVEWTTPATPENSLTISNTGDTDMFDDGVVRFWWDVSASDIELEITNQGGGSGSGSSVYHASYSNFDGSSTSTTTTDFNAQNATTTGTLDFNFGTDEVMILRLWTPDTSLQPGFGYYEVTFTKSSSLYTGTPILCSVRKSSL